MRDANFATLRNSTSSPISLSGGDYVVPAHGSLLLGDAVYSVVAAENDLGVIGGLSVEVYRPHAEGGAGATGATGAAGVTGAASTVTGATGAVGPTGSAEYTRKTVSVYFPGVAATGANMAVWRAGETMTISDWLMGAVVAPSGATCYLDVHKNGTSLWSTQSNRPNLTSTVTGATGPAPNTTTVAKGDVLSIDLDTVGSSVAGSGLNLTLTYTAAAAQ
jgi:hypothetical protein